MLKATLESHDSNRTILTRSILDSESPIQSHQVQYRENGHFEGRSLNWPFSLHRLPDFPFLGLLVKTKEKNLKHQGLFTPSPWKTAENTQRPRNFLGKKVLDQGISKHQGMGDQGWDRSHIAGQKIGVHCHCTENGYIIKSEHFGM